MNSGIVPPHLLRTRWAAIGAAIAVTVGAGSVGLIQATSPSGASAYVPIVPCRLADTRPDSAVGPRTTPLGADEVATYDGWGDVPGDCVLPTSTTGLQLNVTAVGATQLTNLRLYPAGTATPTASNLNPAPGQPPTPNAVAVTLDGTAGRFDVFNRFGSVDVVIDVLGYYTDHDHDDRYYTKAEVDALDPFLPYHPHALSYVGAANWVRDGLEWDHTGAAEPCLLVPVTDPPADTRVNTIRIGYRIAAGLEPVFNVTIWSVRNAAGLVVGGPPVTILTFISEGQELGTGNGFGANATLVHDRNQVPDDEDAGPIPGPGYDTFVQVCSPSTVTVSSLTLDYDPNAGLA